MDDVGLDLTKRVTASVCIQTSRGNGAPAWPRAPVTATATSCRWRD
jgi:hypothetical protein